MVSALHTGASGPGQVQDPAGDIVLCSWARHLTLTVPLSTQVHINGYYTDKFNTGGNLAMY